MEIEHIRKELNELLKSIVEHSNSYSEERKIPSLEISLVQNKVNNLQEKLSVLKHLIKQQENSSKKSKHTENPTQIIDGIQIQKEVKEEPVIEAVIKEVEAPIKVIEPNRPEVIEADHQEQPADIQEIESQKQSVKIPESGAQENVSLGENLEYPPIAKLIDALTLNDRYLYANELFNKDMSSFNELVKSIDNSSSLNEVQGLISSYAWDKENEHVISFNTLVTRRFS